MISKFLSLVLTDMMWISTDHSHGTHLAGTVGAKTNNMRGVAGISPKVKIMTCKFLGKDGSGRDSNAIRCLSYAHQVSAVLRNRFVNSLIYQGKRPHKTDCPNNMHYLRATLALYTWACNVDSVLMWDGFSSKIAVTMCECSYSAQYYGGQMKCLYQCVLAIFQASHLKILAI